MNKFYKVILITASACMILGIMICIIVGITGGWSVLHEGFYTNYETEDVNMTFDNQDIKSLDISISYGEVTIERGSGFSLSATNALKNSFNSTEVENGVLKIKQVYNDTGRKIFGFNIDGVNLAFGDNSPDITITVPDDFTAEKFILDLGAGGADISDISTEYSKFKLGAGDIAVNDFSADKIDVDGGVGAIKMDNAVLNNLNLDTGVGAVIIQGNITGESKISAGVGRLDLDLDGDEDEYYIKLDPGVGEVRINDERLRDSVGDSSAENSIDINAGVGEVRINTD